jgi:hypothetical protein
VELAVLVVLATSIGAVIPAIVSLLGAAAGPSVRKGAATPVLPVFDSLPPPPHAARETLKSIPKNNLVVFIIVIP